MPMNKRSKKQQRSRAGKLRMIPSPPLDGSRHCTLTFCAKHNQGEGAVSAGIYNFYRLNGPYDPDTAVLSNSTPGLSAIAAMYRSMRVWRTAVSVHATATADHRSTLMLCLVPTAFQPVLTANPDYWPVQRDAAAAPFVTRGWMGTATKLAYDASVSKTFDLPKIANLKRSQYLDESDYATLTNSNPTRQLYVAVAVATNSATTVDCSFQVRISYEIEFFDPYPLQ